jgi:hypothetical protein
MKKVWIFLLLASFLQGCGIWKNKRMEEKNTAYQTRILKKIEENRFNARTLSEKWTLHYHSAARSLGLTAKMMMEKDRLIYISVSKFGFPAAKMLITPDSVAFYENINRTYFKAPLRKIKDYLGVELSFEQIQALLTGDPFIWPEGEKIRIRQEAGATALEFPENVYLQKILLNAYLRSALMDFAYEGKTFRMEYPEYDKENHRLPVKIILHTDDMRVEIKVGKIRVDQELKFRFEIPSSYREARIDF